MDRERRPLSQAWSRRLGACPGPRGRSLWGGHPASRKWCWAKGPHMAASSALQGRLGGPETTRVPWRGLRRGWPKSPGSLSAPGWGHGGALQEDPHPQSPTSSPWSSLPGERQGGRGSRERMCSRTPTPRKQQLITADVLGGVHGAGWRLAGWLREGELSEPRGPGAGRLAQQCASGGTRGVGGTNRLGGQRGGYKGRDGWSVGWGPASGQSSLPLALAGQMTHSEQVSSG